MREGAKFSKLEHYGFGPNVMKQMKVCPGCGFLAKSTASYCPECGGKLSAETLFDQYKQKHRTCPGCDTVLTLESQYCPECGRAL